MIRVILWLAIVMFGVVVVGSLWTLHARMQHMNTSRLNDVKT